MSRRSIEQPRTLARLGAPTRGARGACGAVKPVSGQGERR
jgi:hypothetical protein